MPGNNQFLLKRIRKRKLVKIMQRRLHYKPSNWERQNVSIQGVQINSSLELVLIKQASCKKKINHKKLFIKIITLQIPRRV